MGASWKSRGSYGKPLFKLIKKLITEFYEETDFANRMVLLQRIGYLTQVQISNIKVIENYEMLDRLVSVKHDDTIRVPDLSTFSKDGR